MENIHLTENAVDLFTPQWAEPMSQINRKAPNSEWVQMYRQGIPSPKIAAVVGAAETTVRYHLGIAARQDPTLRAEHKAAVQPAPRVTQTGRQNLEDILALYQAQSRLPVAGRSKRESALAGWLVRRRRQAAEGTLSSAYAEALGAIPGWREYPTKRHPGRLEAGPGGWPARAVHVHQHEPVSEPLASLGDRERAHR
jgi:hypothetical protein